MEEINKYYTPEIEEFHPNFPFEYFIDLPKWKEGQTSGCTKLQVGKYIILPGERSPWVKADSYMEFDDYDNSGYSEVLSLINKNQVRVKHLSREDIESLGWEQESSYSGIRFMYEKNVKDFRERSDYLIKLLHVVPSNWICIEATPQHSPNEESVIFSGTIKNKSELKKILKMIGI